MNVVEMAIETVRDETSDKQLRDAEGTEVLR